MKTILRKSGDRGRARFDWLDSRHTFSFGEYDDPRWMGFRALRVINEDRVKPGAGFPTHPHRDMEIVTVVLEGALEHRDSLGTGSVIRVGDVQRMSAGTGIRHSEFNASATEPVHFLQIWVIPDREGMPPGYEQREAPRESMRNALWPLVTPDGERESLRMNADARIFGASLDAGKSVVLDVERGRGAWLQVARGRVRVDEAELASGDGAAFEDARRISIVAAEPSEILAFDLA